jgi:hypothetical protein
MQCQPFGAGFLLLVIETISASLRLLKSFRQRIPRIEMPRKWPSVP